MSKLIVIVVSFVLITGCQSKKKPSLNLEHTPEDLVAHEEAFVKGVYKVSENVHVAIDYGLANSILIEGKDSVIIIDAMESNQTGAAVKAEFEKITSKPVAGIIYTHNHGDHVFGAVALAGKDNPKIYAHENTNYYLDRFMTEIRPVLSKRSYRMHGITLSDEALVNCGIGHRLEHGKDAELGLIRPTHTYKDSMHISISGVDLVLYFAPGETNDQTIVWYPEKKILFCGDNFYHSFPNLFLKLLLLYFVNLNPLEF